MKVIRPFKIIGLGKFLPKKMVTNAELEDQLKISKGWIYKYTGVKTRYHVQEESVSTMGAAALQNALEDAKIKITDLDMLLGGGATFDYILPNRSSSIANEFKEAKDCNFPCIDINSTCLSFISALDFASYKLQDPDINTIAIVTSEIASKGLNSKNAETYSLFGDAATAVIISSDDQGKKGLVRQTINTYTECNKDTIIKGGGAKYFPKEYPYNEELYSFQMNGKRLLRFTKLVLPQFLNNLLNPISCKLQDIDFIIPHQASKLGLQLFTEHTNKYKRENTVQGQLEKYGNCIAASIPLAFIESVQNGLIKSGDSCLLCGTAAGVSIGGLLIKY